MFTCYENFKYGDFRSNNARLKAKFLDKFQSGLSLTIRQLLILRFIFLIFFILSLTLFWKKFLQNVFENIFPKFSLSNKVWFCPDTFSWFVFGQPLPIFVVLNFFSKESRFKNYLLFFILGLMILWSRVQQNHPDQKSVGDFQSWESNRGQQWCQELAK